jgi:hypothetical protein
MDNNSMEELRMLVARLERLFDQQHGFNPDTNARFTLMAKRWDAMAARWDAMAARWDAMAARWDGYIVEQRAMNGRLASFIDEQRQFNQRLQSILERLPPRGDANGGETAP